MQRWNPAVNMLAAGLFAVALAAGCSANQHNSASVAPQAPAKPAGEAGTPASGTKTANAKPAAEDKGAAAPAANPGGTETAGKTVKPASEPKKLYRMNKVYRFVPIDKDTTGKVVLLTFDDGPKEDQMIAPMLDTLDKHHAKAIFFVNGYRVKKHPELLKKIADRGQTIGNHSWDHIDLKKESDEVVDKQLDDVQKIVKDTIGYSPVFFRPPFGSGGDRVKQKANKRGMLFMTWSNGSLDWDSSTKKDPNLVIANVLKQLHPGANILMHELPWTVKGLDTLLSKLEEKGYGFIDPATIDLQLNGESASGAK